MIPNHKEFIEAIKEKKKVCLRFYSKADSGVVDLVCAPMDYGPGPDQHDGVNHYWFWDYTRNTGIPTLSLLPVQVLDLKVLGLAFDPEDFNVPLNVLPLPNPQSARAPAEAIHLAPAAGAEQQLNLPTTEVHNKPSRSQNHESLWKNTNTKTKTT
ncbi:MAG TPA: hypothetical protein VFE51_30595 [Verrucomicrobiae bacterium]|nr:hypothetical protein [Verrucomicrobiae bacterium]